MKYLSLSIDGKPIPLPSGVPSGGLSSGAGQRLISLSISLMLIATVILSLFFLLWGAIQFIMAEGDKQKVQTARGRITYSILGLVLSLSAFIIMNIIGTIFGIKFFTP